MKRGVAVRKMANNEQKFEYEDEESEEDDSLRRFCLHSSSLLCLNLAHNIAKKKTAMKASLHHFIYLIPQYLYTSIPML